MPFETRLLQFLELQTLEEHITFLVTKSVTVRIDMGQSGSALTIVAQP